LGKVNVRAIAWALQKLGFTVRPYASNVSGLNAIFHFVQQLYNRGITIEEALQAITEGKKYRDIESGVVAFTLDATKDGPVKVLAQGTELITI
jgi:hypothetical protein